MRLVKGIVETPMAYPGMRIRDALRICVDKAVPGLPYRDSSGQIVGRFSVRNTLLLYSIPSDMIHGAHLIGHAALHLEHDIEHYRDVFEGAIDPTILNDFVHLAPGAQITKALALMEKFNTGYLFVIENGSYRGIVTRLGLTRVLLEALG